LAAWASDIQVDYFKTAVFYQLLHAIALFSFSLLSIVVRNKLITASQIFCTIGILLFSGSLYAYVITGTKMLGIITPVGGLCLILSWSLVVIALSVKSRHTA